MGAEKVVEEIFAPENLVYIPDCGPLLCDGEQRCEQLIHNIEKLSVDFHKQYLKQKLYLLSTFSHPLSFLSAEF